jgi:nucleoside-diphosphate-sugar epimerase
MTHVLLFGSAGFIGSHVRAELTRNPAVEWVTCLGRDRCDLVAAGVDELASVLRELDPSVVVNCTGRLDGSASELLAANTLVTAKLVDAAARARDRGPHGGTAGPIRLIRLGSAGEYGPVPRGRAATEDDPAGPVSAYGVSHLAATHLLAQAGGLTLRLFNPIGPGQGDANVLGRSAALLRDALARGDDVITLGPLSASRDFVDVRDVARAVVAATLTPVPGTAVLNIGSGRAVTVREAVGLLAGTAGFTGRITEEGTPSARSAAMDWMCADVSRAYAVLGWRPAHDLADSVRAIWRSTPATPPAPSSTSAIRPAVHGAVSAGAPR